MYWWDGAKDFLVLEQITPSPRSAIRDLTMEKIPGQLYFDLRGPSICVPSITPCVSLRAENEDLQAALQDSESLQFPT